jgi:hypothetical protein
MLTENDELDELDTDEGLGFPLGLLCQHGEPIELPLEAVEMFCQADVIMASNAATGDSIVVFGTETLQQAVEQKNLIVDELTIAYDPSDDEHLEDLLAIVDAVKGWHEDGKGNIVQPDSDDE